MPLMGSKKVAKAAVRDELAQVGSGCSRAVYTDDAGKYVYKVGWNEDDDASNVAEHLFFELVKAMGHKLAKYAPPTRLIEVDGRVVLVMPFYPNRTYPYGNDEFSELMDLCEYVGLNDVVDFNTKMDDNDNIYIIDAGEISWWMDPNESLVNFMQRGYF